MAYLPVGALKAKGLHMNVQPFTVQVPEAELVDLQTRLARTRWPDEVAGADWEYGTSLAYLYDLVRYWQEHFD